MPNFQGVKLYVAAWISWHEKGDLEFYNDKNNPPKVSVQKKEPKPRRRPKTET